MENPIWVDGQKSIQKQSTWQERLNKQFFSGIPMDEMGSNQVEESELHGFILSEREALLREIVEEIENYPRKIYKTINEQCIQDGLLLEVREIIKKKI